VFGEKLGQSGYTLDQLIADFGPIATDPEAVKEKIIEMSEGAIDDSSVGPLCEFQSISSNSRFQAANLTHPFLHQTVKLAQPLLKMIPGASKLSSKKTKKPPPPPPPIDEDEDEAWPMDDEDEDEAWPMDDEEDAPPPDPMGDEDDAPPPPMDDEDEAPPMDDEDDDYY
jgi:hypothetical protein